MKGTSAYDRKGWSFYFSYRNIHVILERNSKNYAWKGRLERGQPQVDKLPGAVFLWIGRTSTILYASKGKGRETIWNFQRN